MKRMLKHAGLVGSLGVASWFAAGCQSPTPPSTAVVQANGALPDRDVALARKLIQEGALVLDVRSQEEWNDGHHDKAHLIPVGELDARLREVETLVGGKKDTPVVVYCRSGARASAAKQHLLAAGFTRVTNVGGLSALQ